LIHTCLGGRSYNDGDVEDLAELGMSVHGVARLDSVVISRQAEQTFLHVKNDESLNMMQKSAKRPLEEALHDIGRTVSFLLSLS
jgi:hypothetical protein